MKELSEKAKALGIMIYQPSFEMDNVLMHWWHEMYSTGDLGLAFGDPQLPFTTFMQTFQPPNILLLSLDIEAKAWCAGWFKPFNDAALVGAWVREEMRKTPKSIEVAHVCYQAAFKLWPTLISITPFEPLLKLHRNWGYNILGQIPSLLSGKDTWIMYLTEEGYKKSKAYRETI